MTSRDHNYLIRCAAYVETDERIGKVNTSYGHNTEKCITNAIVCGVTWFFVHAYYILDNVCDVRLDDYLVSFTIGLIGSVFLGAFFTNKYIEKRNREWHKTYDLILASLKK